MKAQNTQLRLKRLKLLVATPLPGTPISEGTGLCGPCGRMMMLGNAGICLDCELFFRMAKLERAQFVRELQRFRK